jgi:hypothetical protein
MDDNPFGRPSLREILECSDAGQRDTDANLAKLDRDKLRKQIAGIDERIDARIARAFADYQDR